MTMVMTQEISASQFKARCLALLDEVAATGETLVVTKRGKPVARVAPIEAARPLLGSATFLVDDDALIAPIEVGWDADRPSV